MLSVLHHGDLSLPELMICLYRCEKFNVRITSILYFGETVQLSFPICIESGQDLLRYEVIGVFGRPVTVLGLYMSSAGV